MADVITRFRLETTQYDSKLRDAAKGLKEVVRVAELGGKDFKNFSDKAIENARALGQTASGATNAKDLLKDLVGSFNEAAKAYNRLSQAQQQSDFGKNLSQSLEQLQQRIKQTKDELYGLGDAVSGKSGGLFGGDKLSGMLQVFGGNVMTKIAGAGLSFASELGDAVKQGIELAKQGEGIRIAFERLGRGDILQGLREATHGTVTDLELMKAAVKFNDFKLPLDELGTMLAFAQQKAKDTGQSVDYMVDSIVTGLGRKSLMILDNLGLSAAEIRDKMKETGDMTKAVGEIIREQMSKAGDYVETAADRALQANVSLQNKMEELGRKFAPVQEASNQLWTSIKIRILDIVGGPLARLLNSLTQAGQLRNAIADAGGSERVTADINKLKGSNYNDKVYTAMLNRYSREEQAARNNWLKAQKGGMGSVQIWKNQYDAATALRQEFQSRGSAVVNPIPSTTTTTQTTPVPVEVKNPPKSDEFDPSKVFFDTNKANLAAVRGIGGDSGPSEAFAAFSANEHALKPTFVEAFTEAFQSLNTSEGLNKNGTGEEKKKDEKPKQEKDMGEKLSTLASGLSTLTSGIESLGFEIPDGVKQFIGAIQGIASIIQGVQTVISVFQTSSMTANTAAIIANTAALMTNSATHFIPFMANGGVAHAASGYSVPGNHFSGDMVPLMVNSGELILNRAQQGNLASQLIGGGMGQMQLEAVVRGEDLRFILNSNGRRTGRGEIVTTNFR